LAPPHSRDPRFATHRGREVNARELIGILDNVFATKDFAEWRSILDAAGIIFGIVAKMEDIANDPQMLASEALVPFTDSETMTVNSPIWIKGPRQGEAEPRPQCRRAQRGGTARSGLFRCRDRRAARRRRDRLSFCGKEPISFPRPVPPLVSAT
jgi:crotonobetainyl-CoA:carnitine CoA-transferase CaiB-like acyl-CoA transferase